MKVLKKNSLKIFLIYAKFMFLLEYFFPTTFWEPSRVKTAFSDKNAMSYTQNLSLLFEELKI
jgi:hypothetical protein